MSVIIDCKAISTDIRNQIKAEIQDLAFQPGLAVIMVGNNPASQTYVRNKKKACEEVGIYFELHQLQDTVSTNDIVSLIRILNYAEHIHGILVQLPLPKHINAAIIMNAISPSKDVDVLTYENVGRLVNNNYDIAPCTPTGIISIIDSLMEDITGKNCVVIGRSDIVGKPIATMLLQKNATVTICHSYTNNLADICKNADILISAVGKEKFVTENMVKDGAIVIDVGINRNSEGKLVGDVDTDDLKNKMCFLTPVPGGVGVMTVTSLLRNIVSVAKFEAKDVQNDLPK